MLLLKVNQFNINTFVSGIVDQFTAYPAKLFRPWTAFYRQIHFCLCNMGFSVLSPRYQDVLSYRTWLTVLEHTQKENSFHNVIFPGKRGICHFSHMMAILLQSDWLYTYISVDIPQLTIFATQFVKLATVVTFVECV